MGIGRAAGEVNTAPLQLHHDQQMKCHQSALGPDFNGGEINRHQHVPVGFEERGPRGLPLSERSRFDAVGFQDIAHGLIGDLVAEVIQSRLEPIITPGRILPDELQDQIHDHLRSSRSVHRFPLLAVIPLLGHEFAMPAEDRVRRNDRGHLQERFPANVLAFHSQ